MEDFTGARRIVRRFGLEPTWGFKVLDTMGIPAAQRLTRQTTLADARDSGLAVALLIGTAGFVAIEVGLVLGRESPTVNGAIWGIVAILCLLLTGRLQAVYNYQRVFLVNEQRYYSELEQLLELHRFDLYRFLALQAPRDAEEERGLSLAEWRQGAGGPAYATAAGDANTVGDQVAALTDLMRGPELVAYQGFVSWQFLERAVELTFAGHPTSANGSARVEVEGVLESSIC